MKQLKEVLSNLKSDEAGQDLIEYALVAGLLALGAIAAMHTLSNSIVAAFGTINNSLTGNI